MFPKPKYVIFIWFLLRPNLSTEKSGLPDFYSVKLDVIGFAQKPHFWNQGTSYINALYLVSQELFDLYLKLIKMTRGRHIKPGDGYNKHWRVSRNLRKSQPADVGKGIL